MTQIFVPSIYGDYKYGTILYGGQWITLPPPPGPPPPVIPPGTTPPPAPAQIPPGYGIGPVVAQAINYETILLTWNQPVNTSQIVDFRVLRSRYGFPVDQNDGTILLDSETTANQLGGYPGSLVYDMQVIPGQMHYYGIYILIQLAAGQVWYRAGFSAVLAPVNYGSSTIMLSRLPEFYTTVNPTDELTSSDVFGNSFLNQFMQVFGWAEDYLQTQLSIVKQSNNPQVIPVNMLANLAATIGFPYYPEITSGVTRNAMSNASALIKQRGTLEGIEAMITQLTSWGADISVGWNQMLEDDQAEFLDPAYPAWDKTVSYELGEYVTYAGFTYQSAQNNNLNNTPPSTGPPPASTSWWTAVYYAANAGPVPAQVTSLTLGASGVAATNPNSTGVYVTITGGTVTVIAVNGVTTGLTSGEFFVPGKGTVTVTYSAAPTMTTAAPVLLNQATQWLNTWEPQIAGMTNSYPTNATALSEYNGIYDPVTLEYQANGLAILNNSGSTSNVTLMSVARTPSDISLSASHPNTGQVIGDAIPVQYLTSPQAWSSAVQYATGAIVSYQGLPFLALKSSKNIVPPSNGVPTNEWQPVGYDARIALMLSGYTTQSFADATVQQYAVTPIVQWYDETGTFISQVAVRTPPSGNTPDQITYDSFSLPSSWGTSLASTSPDIKGSDIGAWTQQAGTFQVNAFGGGSIVTTTTGQVLATMDSGTTLNGMCSVGITFASAPNISQYAGLILRYSSVTSYIRVDQYAIVQNNAGVLSVLASHSAPFASGDRMTATISGSNVITVYRNGTQVSTATTSFNSTMTKMGVIVENTAVKAQGTMMPRSIQQMLKRPRRKLRGRAVYRGMPKGVFS